MVAMTIIVFILPKQTILEGNPKNYNTKVPTSINLLLLCKYIETSKMDSFFKWKKCPEKKN